MSFIPKNIFIGRNSDGSTFRAEQWDYSTLANMEFGLFIIKLVLALLLASVASPILLVLSVLAINEGGKLFNLLGVIFGTYFLFDCSNGWLSLIVCNIFYEESSINILVALNVASLTLNSLFLFFGNAIVKLISEKYQTEGYRWVCLIGFIVVVGFTITQVSLGSVKHKKGWVDANCKSESDDISVEAVKSQEELKREKELEERWSNL